MEIGDKLTFMRYAAPCVDDLVERGLTTKKYAKEILEATKRGEVLPNSELQFDLAHLMCEYVAKKLGKNEIDTEAIRVYYMLLHNNLLKIHKPVTCSIEECEVKVMGEIAEVNTSFFKEINKPNLVVHRGYVVDLLTNEELEGILSKSTYLAIH